MLLFWVAYTFLYATAFWSRLDAPGASYINSVTARLGRPTSPIPIPSEAPTLIPTSTRIPVPDTIIFPASPLPTARLRHKALPLCYGGLDDDLASATGPATRTATGTSTDLIANGPGLMTRYLLVTSALAAALATHLVHSSPYIMIICILGLVCLSWFLFVMRRVAFESTATRIQVSIRILLLFHKITLMSILKAPSRCPCSRGGDSDARDVAGSESHSVSVDTPPSPSPPLPCPLSPPPTSSLKKLATVRPALTKTDRMIGTSSIDRLPISTLTLSSKLGSRGTVAVARLLRRPMVPPLLPETILLPALLPHSPLPLNLSRRIFTCGPSKTVPRSNTPLQ